VGHTLRSSGLLPVEASQVRISQFSLKTGGGAVCTWHHHRGCVEDKLKTDESMRWAMSDPATLTLPFSLC
jgi:hypothetical protein